MRKTNGKRHNQHGGDNNSENQSMQFSRNTSDKLTYLLVGGGIGALVALLFAPKSGTELRTDIADATRKGYDRTRETATQLGHKSTDYLSTAKQKAGDVYNRAGGALGSVGGFGSRTGDGGQTAGQSVGELTGGDLNTLGDSIQDAAGKDDLPVA